MRILVEPKNALIKQYQRMFELDSVELEFDDDALVAVAEQALLRGTGARGPAGHHRRGPPRGDVRPAQPHRHRQVRHRPRAWSWNGWRRPSCPGPTPPPRPSGPAGLLPSLAAPGPGATRSPISTATSTSRPRSRATRRRRSTGWSRCARSLGDPQTSYPVVHITGTNGKGSTTRMASPLLAAHGLSVGTYTSPHLERLNERSCWNGEPIDDDEPGRGAARRGPSWFEDHLGASLTHFEVLTAAALAVVRRRRRRRRRDRGRPGRAVGLHQRVRRRRRGRHQRRPRPRRGDRPDPDGDRRSRRRGSSSRRRPWSWARPTRRWSPIFLERPSAAVLAARRGLRVRPQPSSRSGGRLLDLRTPARRHRRGVPAAARAAPGGQRRVRGGRGGGVLRAAGRPPKWSPAAFAAVRCRGGSRSCAAGRSSSSTAPTTPTAPRALARTLEEDFAGRRPDVLVVGFTAGRDPAAMLGGDRRVERAAHRGGRTAASACAAGGVGCRRRGRQRRGRPRRPRRGGLGARGGVGGRLHPRDRFAVPGGRRPDHPARARRRRDRAPPVGARLRPRRASRARRRRPRSHRTGAGRRGRGPSSSP